MRQNSLAPNALFMDLQDPFRRIGHPPVTDYRTVSSPAFCVPRVDTPTMSRVPKEGSLERWTSSVPPMKRTTPHARPIQSDRSALWGLYKDLLAPLESPVKSAKPSALRHLCLLSQLRQNRKRKAQGRPHQRRLQSRGCAKHDPRHVPVPLL